MRRGGALVLFIALTAAAFGEEERTSFFHGTRLFTGVHAELWTYAHTRTFEAIVPVYYSMTLDHLVKGLAFDLVTSPTLGMLDVGTEVPADWLFAVANTKVRLSYNLADVVLATVGMQIPTGGNALSAREKNVQGAIATEQMNFEVGRVPTGLDVDATLSTSIALTDRFVLGAGAGVLLHGRYTPLEGGKRFNPGDEYSFTLGAELSGTRRRAKRAWLTDVGVTLYTADREDTATAATTEEYIRVFKPGTRFTIDSRLSIFSAEGAGNVTTVSVRLTGDNEILAQDSLIDTDRETNAFVVTNLVHLAPKGRLRPSLIGKGTFFTPNEDGIGQSALGGAGAGMVVNLTRRVTLDSRVVIEAGAMDGGFLLGTELRGGVRYVF
jgi:hypothetical protein